MDLRSVIDSSTSPLADVVGRALAETGGWSVPAMRAPGFRTMEAAELAGIDPNFRALAPLPERSQVVIDRAVVEVGLQRLTFVADLMAEGLVYPLTNPLS